MKPHQLLFIFAFSFSTATVSHAAAVYHCEAKDAKSDISIRGLAEGGLGFNNGSVTLKRGAGVTRNNVLKLSLNEEQIRGSWLSSSEFRLRFLIGDIRNENISDATLTIEAGHSGRNDDIPYMGYYTFQMYFGEYNSRILREFSGFISCSVGY